MDEVSVGTLKMNKEQQKLFKEREISDFVDAASENGFSISQSVTDHITNLITVWDKKKHCDVLQIKLTEFTSNKIPKEPFSLYRMEDFNDESDFDRLTWLFKHSNQLIDKLRYNTKDVKPTMEDKPWI